ncbi:MAG: hemerythrin family protein [Betaproteobacteria bacterium]|nr:hemerythrin family protein [Betaproteobacteria bacterium]
MGTILAGLLPEALVIDLPEVDAQHEEIFVRLEALKDACFGAEARPVDKFGQLLDFVAHHFATEERIAEQAGLEFSRHYQSHCDNLHILGKALNEVRKGTRDVHSFLRFVEFWLERHIVEEDKPFGASMRLLAQPARRQMRPVFGSLAG